MSEAVSIYGHYETNEALVRDVQLALLACLKVVGEESVSSRGLAESIVETVIVPLLEEVAAPSNQG